MKLLFRRCALFFGVMHAVSFIMPLPRMCAMEAAFRMFSGRGGNQDNSAFIQQFGQAFMQGLQSGFDSNVAADGLGNIFNSDRAANAFFGSLNNQFQGGEQANQAFQNFFRMFADSLQNGGASEAMREFGQMLERQFRDGDMRGAMRELFRSIGDSFRGEANQTMDEVLRDWANQFDEGGEAARGIRNAGNRTNEFVDDVGKNLKNRAKEFTDNVGANLGSRLRWGVGKLGVVSALSLVGMATAVYGSRVLWRYIEREIMQPKLILESSRKSWHQRMKDFVLRRKERLTSTPMIFNKSLEERLENIVKATRNIHKKINAGKKNVMYRNLMLYGPPGTGKTMFARQLAKKSGMQFAMMSGASFAKFAQRGESIQALDKLFAWAKKSKGLLIFIDEAESFLSKREKMDPSSDAYQVLTNFLNYTGERSNRFMIVMATNHKDILDSAMHRRIDDLIQMPLPTQTEREKVLALYRDKILFDEKQNGKNFVATAKRLLIIAKIEQMARATEGLSNGDLEGIINTIKTDADITDNGLITNKIIDTAIERAVEKQQTLAYQVA